MLALLGGTSWPSTITYYEQLNVLAEKTLGSGHSADLIIRSVDYFEVRNNYVKDWERVKEFLHDSLVELSRQKATAIVICNNTLHKAYDELTSQLGDTFSLGIPVVHAVDAIANQAKENGVDHLLLLAVKFTLEDGFYQRRLEQAGIRVTIPTPSEIDSLQEIQTRLTQGLIQETDFEFFTELINSYSLKVTGVALACTELPLAVRPETIKVPILDSIKSQVAEAWKYELTFINTD